MLSAEDLSAILDDLEDICARIPEGVTFHPTLEIHRHYANEEATYIKFDCRNHRYILTIIREGVAKTTRVSSREELFRRLFPEYSPGFTEEIWGGG
jgi:hypothetical protein